jgi:heme exporter protein A
MLTVHRLSCSRHEQRLFSQLEFSLFPAEILHITGANGCGKSSLLHILIGLLLPEEGQVCWQGIPVSDKASNYHASLNYIGHKAGVKNNLTVLENLTVAAQLAYSAIHPDWHPVLQYFGLHNLSHTLCHRLSAGQRQRVALTRLLLTDAPLWILDEPFTSLDSDMSAVLQRLLIEHVKQGGMVVLTSHHGLDWQDVSLKQLAL